MNILRHRFVRALPFVHALCFVAASAQAAGLDPQVWLPHGPPQMAKPGSIIYFSADIAQDGSRLIYPPDPYLNRWDYFLRAAPGEGFTVPVWEQNPDRQLVLSGYALPSVVSKPPQKHWWPPGAHRVVPPPTEACPASSAAPRGYHWVKIFLYRADLGVYPAREPYEFVHVAAPLDVNYADLVDTHYTIGLLFSPLRFFAHACKAKPPEQMDMNRDCDQEQIAGFGPKLYSPQQGGDGSAANPSVPIYPLCALQADRG